MYPPILLLNPDLAKAMLNYRMQGIEEAIKRSQSGGYEGARFPWESAFTGAEVQTKHGFSQPLILSIKYQVTPDICPLCRENQQHITGDIALAARQMASVTPGSEWLTTTPEGSTVNAAEFILEMARFWASRPTFNTEKGQYEINGELANADVVITVTNLRIFNRGDAT